MEILYIIIPAYNEEANIAQTIREWYPIVEKHSGNGLSRLVIIDDGSKDNTYNIIKDAEKTMPYLCSVTKVNEGHGAAILYGYKYALEHSTDYVFQTDSDGQTVPGEFEQFWSLRENYDIVIGNRLHREDGFSRVIVSKVLRLIIRLCFGVAIPDANVPFRLVNSGTLSQAVNIIPDGFYLSNVMLSVICVLKSCRVKYIPITFHSRRRGVNSIHTIDIFRTGIRAIKDFINIRKAL